METTVWVQIGEENGRAEPGDAMIVRDGSRLMVGEVDEYGDVLWVHVDAALIPDIPPAGEDPVKVEDAEVIVAVEGVLSAERNRGG